MCKVIHHKHSHNINPNDYVYIGRPSKWGNPFTHINNSLAKFVLNDRNEAINAYKEWLINGEGKYLLNDLYELKGKTLGCWCKPKSCHGDILVELVNTKFDELFS